jgi:hypothetical protein
MESAEQRRAGARLPVTHSPTGAARAMMIFNRSDDEGSLVPPSTAGSRPCKQWSQDQQADKNLLNATIVRNTLQQMNLSYPPSDPALKGLKII